MKKHSLKKRKSIDKLDFGETKIKDNKIKMKNSI